MRKELEIWKENTLKAEKSLHEKLGDQTPFEGKHIDKFLEWLGNEENVNIPLAIAEGVFGQDFLDDQYESFLDDQAILEGISKWEAIIGSGDW